MGGHHKKNLRAEKAKVKLKGAKLPKGLNVTKTEFKVRKILIREQLKDLQYVDGHKQVNLKETLTRLRHHGSNFRIDALRSLREAILYKHDGLTGYMHDLIQGVSSICLDIEREPRRESFNTLSKLLGYLPVGAVKPFFHVISSYLRCAMTHIQPNIQDDSLLMLDVLLEHVPELIAEESGKIFNDFLQMISRVRSEGDSHRTLTVNMGQKQTTIKWRAKVLQRLQSMLQKQCELQKKHSLTSKKSQTYQMHTFKANAPQYFTLKRSFGLPDTSELFTSATVNAVNTINTNDIETIRSYIKHLMPLLFEAWLEVRPQEASNTGKSSSIGAQLLLSHDAALTLKIVMDITGSLWSLVDIHESLMNTTELSLWFKKQYADTFASNFLHLTAFPYQQSEYDDGRESGRKSKKSNQLTGGEYCLLQNISIAYLICRFFSGRIGKKSSKHFTVLLEYLQTIVVSLKQYGSDYQQILTLALNAYLLSNGKDLLQILPEAQRQLLRVTLEAFLNQQFTNKEQDVVLILLSDIVRNGALVKVYGNPEFVKFLEFLPQLLLRPTITQDVLLAMSNLCKQQNEIFLQALAPLLEDAIDNILKIQVQGAVNVFEGKKLIMNLFYWVEQPSNGNELYEKVTTNVNDSRIVSYFKFILLRS